MPPPQRSRDQLLHGYAQQLSRVVAQQVLCLGIRERDLPSLDTAIYKDVLMWLGGAVTGNQEMNDPPGWPAEPSAVA